MKVLQVVRPVEGGMLAHVRALLTAESAPSFDLAAPDPESVCGDLRDETMRLFRVAIIEGLPYHDVFAAYRLSRLVWQNRYQLLHLHGYKVAWVAAIARRLFSLRVPQLLTIHNAFPVIDRSVKGKLKSRLLRQAVSGPDHIIAVSSDIANQLKTYGRDGDSLSLIYNGIDFDRFHFFSSFDRVNARRLRNSALVHELNLDPTRRLVGTALRMIPGKGLDLFLSAARLLGQGDDWIHFIVAGDGPYFAEFQRKVTQAGLGNRVTCVGWWRDMPRFFAGIDVFVFPSQAEGLPLTILEAMASGVPVVATRVGGIPEVIEDGIHGLLVSKGEVEPMAQAIRRLLSDEKLAYTLADNAIRRAQDFSVEHMVNQTLALYERLGNRAARSSRRIGG